MEKREFLKRSLYAAGGMGLLSANVASIFAQKPVASGAGLSYAGQSKVNKREKVLAVLDQSKPNTYVPAAFFLHFNDKLGQGAIDSHIQFFRATNMDFVKVQYEIVVPQIEINSAKDWSKIPVYTKEFFEPQIAVIEALAKELKSEALILPTVYSPLSLAYQTLRKDFSEHVKQDPDAVAKGLNNLALGVVNYIEEAISRGADGFYISTQGGNSKNFGEGELFEKLVVPSDLVVSQAASDKALLNILHICDYGESYYTNIRQFASYPGSIINAPNVLLDGSPIQTRDVQTTFKRPVMGGLDRLGVLIKGTIDETKAAVDKVLSEAAPNFILGADCTVPSETSYERLRAVIDYAHDWRINNAG
jgi:uroporphyrinogen decarboxylase